LTLHEAAETLGRLLKNFIKVIELSSLSLPATQFSVSASNLPTSCIFITETGILKSENWKSQGRRVYSRHQEFGTRVTK
jgi:hypothetical protein